MKSVGRAQTHPSPLAGRIGACSHDLPDIFRSALAHHPLRWRALSRMDTSFSRASSQERSWRRYAPMSNGSTRNIPQTSEEIRPRNPQRSDTRCSIGAALSSGPLETPRILEIVEPLLGEDCHVIANTAWRQEAGDNKHLGRFWHIDSGPHIPRDPNVPWDPRIPYPVFAIAAHIYLWDCPTAAGPTGVIPRSHMSGQAPPVERAADDELQWEGHGAVPIVAEAGDVALFVSDIWHRRLPSGLGDPGRMFIQCHYGRRDLAQRIRPTSVANQLTEEAVARARTRRERTLVGLHPLGFYDS